SQLKKGLVRMGDPGLAISSWAALSAPGYAVWSAPLPWPSRASSSPSAKRRSTWLFQYGGPRLVDRARARLVVDVVGGDGVERAVEQQPDEPAARVEGRRARRARAAARRVGGREEVDGDVAELGARFGSFPTAFLRVCLDVRLDPTLSLRIVPSKHYFAAHVRVDHVLRLAEHSVHEIRERPCGGRPLPLLHDVPLGVLALQDHFGLLRQVRELAALLIAGH